MNREMGMALGLVFMCVGLGSAQMQDQGGRYVVPASMRVAVCGGLSTNTNRSERPLIVQRGATPDEYGAVLIQFDVATLPLDSSLDSVFIFHGKAFGAGDNPSFVVYGVENDWEANTVSMDQLPLRIEKITELTFRPQVDGPIRFPVTDYVNRHLADKKVSFLIEMHAAPGFAQAVEFSGQPQLCVMKEQVPRYDIDELLHPIWKDVRMVNETLSPTSYDGGLATANLAFVPSKIIRVENYEMDKSYGQGKDFTVEGRTLRLTPDSGIAYFNYSDLYHNNPEIKPVALRALGGGYMTGCGDSPFFTDKQLAVTYEHETPWAGPVPQSAATLLPQTFQTLEKGRPLKLVVFGDSISVGYSASGKSSRPPFMPRWADMVVEKLHRTYGSEIDYVNPSLGMMCSDWGAASVEGLAAFKKPDLAVIAFGMNDGGVPLSPEQYLENTQRIMAGFRAANPAVEFILIMSMQPNEKWRSLAPMPDYLAGLKSIEAPGVVVADIWSIHEYLLNHKTYWDMTGNHINHPNDFLVRIYAQTILALLGVE